MGWAIVLGRESSIESLLLLVFESLPELLIDLLWLFPVLFGIEQGGSRRRRAKPRPSHVRLMLSSMILGALVGLVAVTVFPSLALEPNLFGMLTLVSNVVLLGVAAAYYGRLRRKLGQPTMPIAAFWGGAALAFGVCIARLGNVEGLWQEYAQAGQQTAPQMQTAASPGTSAAPGIPTDSNVSDAARSIDPLTTSSLDRGLCEGP